MPTHELHDLLASIRPHRGSPEIESQTPPRYNPTPMIPEPQRPVHDLGTRLLGDERPVDALVKRIEALERDNLVMRETHREIVQENAELRRMLERLLATPAVNGTFPAPAEMESLSCQVWHNVGLTPAQSRGKSEWSLRFEYVRMGHKHAVNLRLFPQQRFLNIVREQRADAMIIELAEVGVGKDTWGGLIQRSSSLGTGRGSYTPGQAAFLAGHTTDMEAVYVALLVDGHLLEFDHFRPSAQHKSGKAASKWISFCKPISLHRDI